MQDKRELTGEPEYSNRKPVYMPGLKGLILGTDYENRETIMKLTGLKTREAIHYRIQQIKKACPEFSTHYDDERKPYWFRKDADLLIGYKIKHPNYPKKRKSRKGVK